MAVVWSRSPRAMEGETVSVGLVLAGQTAPNSNRPTQVLGEARG